MTGARRRAGARKPASSAPAGSPRPEPRTGRARARLPLLPVPALLLAALSPFAVAPAAAQAPSAADTIWSATLRVSELIEGSQYGCDNNQPAGTGIETYKRCTDLLTDDDFTFGGESYSVHQVFFTTPSQLSIGFRPSGPAHLHASTRLLIGNDYQSFEWNNRQSWNGVSVNGMTPTGKIPVAIVRRPGPRIRGINERDGELEVLWEALPGVQGTYPGVGTITLTPIHRLEYTSSTTVGDDAALVGGRDPAAGWIARGDIRDPNTKATISGLVNGRKYRVRVNVRYPNGLNVGQVYTAWSHASGTPAPTPVTRLTPDPDQLTGLTINDGVQDLPLQPNFANAVGLGGPGTYAVHVNPDIESLTVTATWTNTGASGVTFATYDLNRPELGIVAQGGWGISDSGTAQTVPLTDGATLIRLLFIASGGGQYEIYVYHNDDWESANTRLKQLEIQ